MRADRLERQVAFLTEADALKAVNRQSLLADGSRRENSAEHSWHLALFALVLGQDHPDIDLARVVAMLILHDLVEIDVGDNPIHGEFDKFEVARSEDAAAERLFSTLPDDLRARFLDLWREFEAAQSLEAKFAKSLDRFQPLLLNTLTNGGTWTANGITEEQVLARYGPTISAGSESLWAYAKMLVNRFFRMKANR